MWGKLHRETIRNTDIRWSEHNNPTHNSEPAKHIKRNIHHSITWSITPSASKNNVIRKNLEAIYIALLKPSLNEQKEFERLTLFRNGIT